MSPQLQKSCTGRRWHIINDENATEENRIMREDTESELKYTKSIDLCGRISNKLEEALKESDSSGKSKVNKQKGQ